MYKGKHLLIPSASALRQLCLRGRLVLGLVARAVGRAGVAPLPPARDEFGGESSPILAALTMVSGVQISEDAYVDRTPIALDLSLCGQTELIRWLGILEKSCVWAR